MNDIYPVILCGGSGTRLWPLSRRSMPKQFLNIVGRESLFAQTVRRVSGDIFAHPIVITSNEYRFIVAQQLIDAGIEAKAILLEPTLKNTAPSILAAALKLYIENPEAIILVVPSDHYIPDQSQLLQTVFSAKKAAEANSLVTFGVPPNRPETGYGYIKKGTKRQDDEGFSVVGFHEKPDLEEAQKMILEDKFLWNSGIFLMSCKALLVQAKKFVPHMLECVERALKESQKDLDFLRLDEKSWAKIEAKSIDYAIMENADDLSVFPLSGQWSDLGDWRAIMRARASDNHSDKKENILVGNVGQIDCKSSLIWSENPEQVVATIGLQNMIVVAMPDAVLVINKDEAQSVKRAVELLAKQNFAQAYEQPRQFRPWGWFETLVQAKEYQIRRVQLYPQTKMSLQKHQKRSENWVVINGCAEVNLNGKMISLSVNESVDIPPGTSHQISNSGHIALTLIEVRTGNYLGEDDVKRANIS